MKALMRRIHGVLGDAMRRFSQDDASLLGGAISFFAFLSLTPMLLVAVVAVGFVLGSERASAEVMRLSAQALGPEGGPALEALLARPSMRAGSGLVAIGSLLTGLYGASRAFVMLQIALNRAWGVRPREGGKWTERVRQVLRKRAVSVGIVVGVVAATLASVVLKTVLGAMETFTTDIVGNVGWLWTIVELGASTLLLAAFLWLVYYVLPDAEVDRRDVAAGAITAAILLGLGTKLLSFYLTEVAARSLSGLAATIIVTMLWLYYTSLVLLFGAEVTSAVAHARGRPVEPEPHAETFVYHHHPAHAGMHPAPA